MKIGYARVSTKDQTLGLEQQRNDLVAHGCEKIYTDVASGSRSKRPGLEAAKADLRDGDVLVVTRLDRLGRTTVDTLKTIKDLDEAGQRIKALDLDLDTRTPAGRLVASVIISLSEWELDMIRSRTREALEAARRQGRVGGRPTIPREKASAIIASVHGGMSVAETAKYHGVGKSTVYRLKAQAMDASQVDTKPQDGHAR